MDDPEGPSCCFDEWASTNARRARTKETTAPITAELLRAVEALGLEGQSVLDAGCGTGDLALAALAHGASTATGLDLGSGAIRHARELAAARGLADRVHFEIGDASTAQLPASDVVLLNRVVCCYPDASELVANTLAAAGKVFAFTAPVDHGAIGAANRLFMWWSNRWYAMRERKYKGFRVFMHDLNRIHDSVQSAGFIRVQRERRRLVWDLAVYQRERSPA